MRQWLVSASQLVEADSEEEARDECDSWNWEIDDIEEYEEGADHVLRPKPPEGKD